MCAELMLPDSKHFTVQPLAEGVYASIAKSGGAAIGNAGIIDLGELCLVFDTFLTPSAAEDLLRSVNHLVSHAPDLVINSHYHNDHIWGNQVFAPPAHVVASRRTYQLMLTAGKKELDEETAGAAQSLAHFQELQQKADTEAQHSYAELFLGYYEGLVQDLPRLKVHFPDILYDDRLSFQGTKRTAELISYANCHTGDDALLFLPEDGIIFVSDLLFVGCHPYLGDGDPVNLVKTIKEIQGFNASVLVPGHGPLGKPADLNLLIDYVEDCLETAQGLVREGRGNKESIAALEIPERYRDWQFPTFYKSNLRAICGRLTT